jgi:hypothetical protein
MARQRRLLDSGWRTFDIVSSFSDKSSRVTFTLPRALMPDRRKAAQARRDQLPPVVRLRPVSPRVDRRGLRIAAKPLPGRDITALDLQPDWLQLPVLRVLQASFEDGTRLPLADQPCPPIARREPRTTRRGSARRAAAREGRRGMAPRAGVRDQKQPVRAVAALLTRGWQVVAILRRAREWRSCRCSTAVGWERARARALLLGRRW